MPHPPFCGSDNPPVEGKTVTTFNSYVIPPMEVWRKGR